MRWRQIDGEPLDFAAVASFQLGRGDFQVPVEREPGVRIELHETALDEGLQVAPQQLPILRQLESVGFVLMATTFLSPFTGVGARVEAFIQLANDLAVGRIEQQRLGRG
jgi:hypothetical protein